MFTTPKCNDSHIHTKKPSLLNEYIYFSVQSLKRDISIAFILLKLNI